MAPAELVLRAVDVRLLVPVVGWWLAGGHRALPRQTSDLQSLPAPNFPTAATTPASGPFLRARIR